MGLIEQLGKDFDIHTFFGGLNLVIRGKLTRTQFESMFPKLTQESKNNLNTLQNVFTNLPNLRQKDQWYNDLKSVVYLLEDERITKAKAKTLLGL